MTPPTTAPSADLDTTIAPASIWGNNADDDEVTEELIEEVSIDGLCGVY